VLGKGAIATWGLMTALLVACAESPTVTEAIAPSASGAPADWTECSNGAAGYIVSYPGTWFMDSTAPENECRWFARERFELEEGTEPPPVDLMVVPTALSFRRAADIIGESEGDRLVDKQETVLAGYDAVEFESVSTGGAELPEGTQRYGFVLDVGGEGFLVETQTIEDGQYPANKDVVRQVIPTLRFDMANG
jgi:hypothetical protein